MNYAQIRDFDVANGPGVRTSFFVSGCTHMCYGCFNEDYQNFTYGQKWTKKETQHIINNISKDVISGLSILGGEPMDNAVGLLPIVKEIRTYTKRLNKTIWLWSGYTWEQIIEDPNKFKLVQELDVLVDGKFEISLKNLNLKFRGSENQRIINVQESLRAKKLVLMENY